MMTTRLLGNTGLEPQMHSGLMSFFTALSNVGTYNLPRMAHPTFGQKGW